ncbi:hypothetical protein KM043_000352 [Ampulex compressa]|nr:hypothetical protein KM043_000352 [Ampulex compressa]
MVVETGKIWFGARRIVKGYGQHRPMAINTSIRRYRRTAYPPTGPDLSAPQITPRVVSRFLPSNFPPRRSVEQGNVDSLDEVCPPRRFRTGTPCESPFAKVTRHLGNIPRFEKRSYSACGHVSLRSIEHADRMGSGKDPEERKRKKDGARSAYR